MTPEEKPPSQPAGDIDVLRQTPRRAAPIAATRRMFQALSSHDYRLIFFGLLLSNIGTWMQRVAQSWLILTLSDSPFYLGLDAFMSDFPMLLLAPLGGVAADRFDRRKLMGWTQVLMMLLAGVLAMLTYHGRIEVWHIITISFLFGCVQAFNVPTMLSFLPTLVQRQELSSAIALNSFQFNASRVIGPAVAGILLLRAGAAFCFLFNSISFFAIILSLFWMRPQAHPVHSTISVRRSLLQGAEYIRRHRLLGIYLLTVFVFSFCAMPMVTIMPLFARDILHSGPGGFSQMLSLYGAGAIVGALWVAGAADIRRKVDRVILTMSTFAFSAFLFAASSNLVFSSVVSLMLGTSIIASNVSLNTMIQNEAPGRLRGRIMSMYGLAFRGGMPLGSLLAGAVAHWAGGPAAVATLAVLLSVYTAIFIVFLRQQFREKA